MYEKDWLFEEIDTTIDAFERVLRSVGIEIKSGSHLEHGCLVLKDLHSRYVEFTQTQRLRPWPTMHVDTPLAAGILNLAALIVDRQGHPDFPAIVPHLALLNDGMPAQTVRADRADDASNKIFELRLALACLRSGTGLRMDDPVGSSGGTNPDILCRMSDGRIWGFACKVIHGQSPITAFERLSEAVHQIERSPAEVGIPVLSFKNRLPYNKIMPVRMPAGSDPVIEPHHSEQQVIDITSEAIREFVREMAVTVTDRELDTLLRGKKALTAVASPIDCAALIAGMPVPILGLFNYLRIVELNHLKLAQRFNHRAQKVADDINVGLARRGTG